MKVMDTFLLPWKMSQIGMRWLALGLLTVAVIAAALFATFSHKPDVWVRVLILVGVAQALIWPLCMGTTILLTIDAQQLRLPGIQRQAVAGVLLNVVLGALLPALVIGWLNGHTVAAALLIALMIVSGWLYSLLPRLFSLVLGMTGIFLIQSGSLRLWPTHANFIDWAWPAMITGIVVVALCWYRLVTAPSPYQISWHSPMALRLSRGLSSAVAGGRRKPQALPRPEWLQVRGDLRHCGPGHPVTSLRMAFGGAYMPLTFVSWLRRIAVAVVVFGIFGVWFVVGDLRNMTFSGIFDGNALALLMLGGAAACAGFALACLTELKIRWRSVNAELPLLALLPALGNEVKRDVLRAALWPPLRMLLLAALLVLAVLPRIGTREDIFILLLVLGAASFVIAFILRVAGRCASARWEQRIVGFLGLLLFTGTILAGVFSIDADVDRATLNMFYQALLLGWLIVAVMLIRLGRDGWRALQRQAHPFLVS